MKVLLEIRVLGVAQSRRSDISRHDRRKQVEKGISIARRILNRIEIHRLSGVEHDIRSNATIGRLMELVKSSLLVLHGDDKQKKEHAW